MCMALACMHVFHGSRSLLLQLARHSCVTEGYIMDPWSRESMNLRSSIESNRISLEYYRSISRTYIGRQILGSSQPLRPRLDVSVVWPDVRWWLPHQRSSQLLK